MAKNTPKQPATEKPENHRVKIPVIDMDELLQQYPPPASSDKPSRASRPSRPNQSACHTAAKSQQSSGELNDFDMDAALNLHPPSTKDLEHKGLPTDPRQILAQKENRHQGEQRRQLRQELKRCNIDDEIDLHGLFEKDARERLQVFFYRAQNNGLRKIRIVHGKGHHSSEGKGVLQAMVWAFLQEAKAAGIILEFRHPPERDGGRGATIALLRRKSEPTN